MQGISQPPGVETRQIDRGDYLEVFSRLWDRLEHRFLKLECEQFYSEPDDPSFVAFQRGNVDSALSLFQGRLASEEQFLKDISLKNLDYTRLRIVQQPFSDYLRYELKTYQLSVRYGQRIFVIDRDSVDDIEPSQLRDIMIFDSYALISLAYDSSGLLHRTLLTEDSEIIQQQTRVVEELIKRSVSLGIFERQHGLR